MVHKKTDYPYECWYSFPLSTQRFLERPRGEGGDAKRQGVRIRESNDLLNHLPSRIEMKSKRFLFT